MRFVWTLSSYHTCCLRYTQGCADWLNRCHKWRRPRSEMDIRACDSLSWGEKQENEHLAESKAALYMNIMFMIDAVSAIMIGAQIAKDFFFLISFLFVQNEWRTYLITSSEYIGVLWPDLRLGQSSFCGPTPVYIWIWAHVSPSIWRHSITQRTMIMTQRLRGF